MCLILFAVQPSADLKLVVAANRDEFYARPASRLDYWHDDTNILAGRDLEMGGTWLGISRQGRFAAVTNFKEDPVTPVPPKSRGELTSNFLAGNEPAETFLQKIQQERTKYRGFNLIVGDFSTDNVMYYYNNRANQIRALPAGFYGLSNQLLDCNWPKVIQGRQKLSQLVALQNDAEKLNDELLSLLVDKGDGEAFSNSFIASAEYGTCAASMLTLREDGGLLFREQGFTKHGKMEALTNFQLQLPLPKTGSSC